MSIRTRHGMGQRKGHLVIEPLEDRQLPSVVGLDFLAPVSQPDYSPSIQQETEMSFAEREDTTQENTFSRPALVELQTTLEPNPLINSVLEVRDTSPLIANMDPSLVLANTVFFSTIGDHSFFENRVAPSSTLGLIDEVKDFLTTRTPLRNLIHRWLANQETTSQPTGEVNYPDETKPGNVVERPSTWLERDEVLKPLQERETSLPPPRPRHVLPWLVFNHPGCEIIPGSGRSQGEEVGNKNNPDDSQNVQAKANHSLPEGVVRGENQGGKCWGHFGALLPWGFASFSERTHFTDDSKASEGEDACALQGAGLLSGAMALNTAALDAVLGQLAAGLDEMGRSLTETLTGYGSTPWLLGALVTGLAVEISLRRTHKQRLRLGVAGLGADPTFSWMPGLPGSFSVEQE